MGKPRAEIQRDYREDVGRTEKRKGGETNKMHHPLDLHFRLNVKKLLGHGHHHAQTPPDQRHYLSDLRFLKEILQVTKKI